MRDPHKFAQFTHNLARAENGDPEIDAKQLIVLMSSPWKEVARS